MDGVTITKAAISACRSPFVEKASRELAQMPVTEACVSGLCDFCLYQTETGLCEVFGRQGDDSPRRRGSGN